MSIYVIGEIGINHNGDVSIVKKLIDIAKFAGCNAIKFQKSSNVNSIAFEECYIRVLSLILAPQQSL